MIFGNAWMMTLAMPAAGLAAAFLGGRWAARKLWFRKPEMRSRKPEVRPRKTEAVELPTAGGAVSPVSSAVPMGEHGNSLLLSHEMRNYLCAIRGNAHLLRQKARSPEQAAILDRIESALERLEGFAAGDSTAPDVTAPRLRERIDPIQAARTCCRDLLASGRAEFSFNASEGLPYIQGDPHRLEQVFVNLYGNALEAGADRVTTRFRRIGNELEISVDDNGRGCAPETVARLFEPFFSTKASPAAGVGFAGPVPSGPGRDPVRGLGLFIARSIVENHGGRIRATSKNDRGYGETGLVVYMHFPVPASVSQGERAISVPEDSSPPARKALDTPLPERRHVAAGA